MQTFLRLSICSSRAVFLSWMLSVWRDLRRASLSFFTPNLYEVARFSAILNQKLKKTFSMRLLGRNFLDWTENLVEIVWQHVLGTGEINEKYWKQFEMKTNNSGQGFRAEICESLGDFRLVLSVFNSKYENYWNFIKVSSGRKMVPLYSTLPDYKTASKLLRIAIWLIFF